MNRPIETDLLKEIQFHSSFILSLRKKDKLKNPLLFPTHVTGDREADCVFILFTAFCSNTMHAFVVLHFAVGA